MAWECSSEHLYLRAGEGHRQQATAIDITILGRSFYFCVFIGGCFKKNHCQWSPKVPSDSGAT